MSKIILTRGIPGSGKSTWAKTQIEESGGSVVRLNRDDMRESLFGVEGMGTREQEEQITKLHEHIARKVLAEGKDVIVDSMNLNDAYNKHWGRLGYSIEFKDFPVSILECIERDSGRGMAGGREVGVKAIAKIAKRFKVADDGTLQPPKPVQVHEYTPAPPYSHLKNDAIIVDIDGTLADHTGVRNPYDTSKYHLDDLHADVAQAVDKLEPGMFIIIVSGRSDKFEIETRDWLHCHGVAFDFLKMRAEGDNRDDALVKHDIFHEEIAPSYNVRGVFDDRARVLRMWRKIGLTTFAVGDLDNNDF